MIKGITASERERYYTALEAADTGFHNRFADTMTPAALREWLVQGTREPLMLLLCEGWLARLDRLTVLSLAEREPALELPDVLARLGVKEPALRKRIERGTLLSIRRGKRVYSHPLLAL